MHWLRRKRTRRLTASLALAGAVLHVAFLSLHVGMMAALAFAGDANATAGRHGFVICGPPRVARDDATKTAVDASADAASVDTATFCPVCTGGTSPILVVPDLPQLPAHAALDAPAPFDIAPAIHAAQHQRAPRQSRAPPHTA